MKPPMIWLLVLFLAGCAASPVPQDPVNPDKALSGEVILGRAVAPSDLPQDDVLRLSPEIRQYLATIAPDRRPRQRLKALIDAFERRDFTVQYEADTTLGASETFLQRRGNCMAFTLMMVAMARELGADAYFNQVDVPPVWGHEDAESFVVYRHINMVSESARGRRVVDFNLEAYDPIYDQVKLSDTEAIAQYYSNRGVELMRENRSKQAFLYLRKALQLLPGDSDLWSNLGALYSRFGYLQEAEQSYRQALQLKAGNLVAISNLERLYRASGRIALADAYVKKARYHRERNPYYLYYQARNAYEHGDYRQAKTKLRRALWEYNDDHRFHFLMGLANYRLGQMAESKEHFVEAFSLVDNPAAKNAYSRKLKYLRREE